MAKVIISEINECLEGIVAGREPYQNYRRINPVSYSVSNGMGHYFCSEGQKILKVGKLKSIGKSDISHGKADNWTQLDWVLILPYRKLVESTGIAHELRSIRKSVPLLSRWTIAKQVMLLHERGYVRPGPAHPQAQQIYGLEKEIAEQGAAAESKIGSRLESYFRSGMQNDFACEIGLSDAAYSVTLTGIKTSHVLRKIPVGVFTVATSSYSTGSLERPSRQTDYIMGTVEGKLHTFKLVFTPKQL
jgi:hypothetical protein